MRHTSPNATVIVGTDGPVRANFELIYMFWSHRDVYLAEVLPGRSLCELSADASHAASPLYIASYIPTTGKWAIFRPSCP